VLAGVVGVDRDGDEVVDQLMPHLAAKYDSTASLCDPDKAVL
jgi:hypothetical protein